MMQNEKSFCDLLINEIIDTYKETKKRLGLDYKDHWNRDIFSTVPKCKLLYFCKILKKVLEQEKNCFGQDIIHKGSLFHYFMVHDRENPLKRLMDLTIAVNNSSSCNLLDLAQDFETLDNYLNCLYSAEEIVGRRKVQKYLLMCNKSGNTLLHEWAKKGNFIFQFIFLVKEHP